MRKILFYFLSVCLLYPARRVAGNYTGHIQEHGTYCYKYASNSKDVFDKATFNQGNVGTNQNETLMK
jgi:hypothetical protein